MFFNYDFDKLGSIDLFEQINYTRCFAGAKYMKDHKRSLIALRQPSHFGCIIRT